jgi:hypothetical protein
MPTIHDLKQSKFLTRQDVTPPILVTIAGYEKINVAKEGAPPEEKYCLNLNEVDKPFVLNSTNGQIIAGIAKNEDFEGWIGVKVVLYDDPNISFGGKLTGGIRVRAPKAAAIAPRPTSPKPVPVPPPQPEPAPAADDDVPF